MKRNTGVIIYEGSVFFIAFMSDLDYGSKVISKIRGPLNEQQSEEEAVIVNQ